MRSQVPNNNLVPRNNTRPSFSSNGQRNINVIDSQFEDQEEYYEDDYLYQNNPEYREDQPDSAENTNGAALRGLSATPNNPRLAQ